MTTPSPDRDDQNQAADSSPPVESGKETPTNLRHETPAFAESSGADELPGDLTAEERAKATAALGFLSDVRQAARHESDLPKTIGRYSIIRPLGRGGFAEVFLAEDPELNRRVALKVPLFNTALNAELRQRFEREARLAATLGHPQIIPVYEYGTVGPLRFIAFEWCDGTTLSRWTEQNAPVDFRTCAEIACHLADAVQHAHQRGVIHRDLKPSNVLVEAPSDTETDQPIWTRLRITDFGLARSSDQDTSLLTQDGRIVGTPAYMSPEQAAGVSDVYAHADIWALGMMLFELLTGELPFRRDDTLATARAITDEPVPRAGSLRKEVPAGLDAIVDLCLRKPPLDRYESAHALSEDLRRWLNGEPVHARPLSAFTKATMWMRRNPLPAASIATTIAALVVGLSIAMWQRNEAINSLREAEAQTSRADNNLQTAQTLIRDIVALEKRMQPLGQLSQERANLVRRAAQLQRELVEDEIQTPQVRYDTAVSLQELSTLLGQLQQFGESVEVSREALRLIEGLEDDLPAEVSPAMLYQMRTQQRIRAATSLSATNRNAEATTLYDEAEAEPLPLGISPLQRATWLSEMRRGRAIMLGMQGDRAAAAAEYERALSYFEGLESPTEDEPRWNFYLCQSRLHTGLGLEHTSLEALDVAGEHFEKASIGLTEMYAIFPDHATLADQQMQLAHFRGALAEQQSDWNAAIGYYETSRAAALRAFHQNPKNLMPANFFVMTSVGLCRTHEKNDALERAEEVARVTFETAKDFPEGLQRNKAFIDNLNALKPLLMNENPNE